MAKNCSGIKLWIVKATVKEVKYGKLRGNGAWIREDKRAVLARVSEQAQKKWHLALLYYKAFYQWAPRFLGLAKFYKDLRIGDISLPFKYSLDPPNSKNGFPINQTKADNITFFQLGTTVLKVAPCSFLDHFVAILKVYS